MPRSILNSAFILLAVTGLDLFVVQNILMSLLVRNSSHGGRLRTLLLFSSSISYSYSTLIPRPPSNGIVNKSQPIMVAYLIDSLGFSRDEAISASTQVSHLKSTHNSTSVINIFKHAGGLDQSHLRDLVFAVPKILLHNADQNLENKIRVLRDIGLSGSDLVKLVKSDPTIFSRGLDSCIVPNINYLRQLLGGCSDKVVKAINRSSWLLKSPQLSKRMHHNIILLQETAGFSDEQIEKIILVHNPRTFFQKTELIQDILRRVEMDLGIPRHTTKFFYGFLAVAKASRSTVENKFTIFRSFGWSDSEILTFFRASPTSLSLSESIIRQKLNFYTKELGYTPAYLASCNSLFGCSLEKRVKPRNEVLNILKEKMLVEGTHTLYRAVLATEQMFLKRYVLPFKDEIPNLYEIYTSSMKQQS